MWYRHNAIGLPGATGRPGVAKIASALARFMDNPNAVGSQPPAASAAPDRALSERMPKSPEQRKRDWTATERRLTQLSW